MLEIETHKQFAKDMNNVKWNTTNTAKFITYLQLLQNDNSLPKEANDHFLSGEWKNTKEFHLGGDLLVIYQIDKQQQILKLIRIGTHSQLF